MVHHAKSYSLRYVSHSIKLASHNLDKTEKSCEASNEIICKTKQREKCNPFLGFFYAFMSSVLLTLSSVIAKQISYISAGQLSLARNTGIMAGCLPIVIYGVKGVLGPPKDTMLLLLHGFLGATALYLSLIAFRNMPVAETAVVLSITPTLSTVVAYFCLKEYCGRIQILCLLITLCGVLLSVRFPELLSDRTNNRFDSAYLGGLVSAVGCVIILSAAFVTMRKVKHLHFSIQLIYIGILGMTENSLINFILSDFVNTNCGWDPILVMLIGIFSFAGLCTMSLAFQVETVGIVAVVKCSLDIVVAMILQIVLFNQSIGVYNIIGAFLVIASVSIIGFSRWLRVLPESSKTRKKLKCFL